MSVLTLADFKQFMSATTTTSDVQMQQAIDAAEGSIVAKCGPLISTTVTYRARGGKAALTVPVTPLISITSVTPVNGTAIDVTKLNGDPAGVIEYLAGGCFAKAFHDITYTAGRTITPPDLIEAVKEHAKHMFESVQGSTRRAGTSQTAPPAAAYLFTWRVNELISPYVQAPF